MSEARAPVLRYGLAALWGSVRFEFKTGHVHTVLLGIKTTEGALTRCYACRPGTGPVFSINDNLSNDVHKTASEWRERHVADFDLDDVAVLRFITPQRTVVCAKTEDQKVQQGTEEWKLAVYNGPVAEIWTWAPPPECQMPCVLTTTRWTS